MRSGDDAGNDVGLTTNNLANGEKALHGSMAIAIEATAAMKLKRIIILLLIEWIGRWVKHESRREVSCREMTKWCYTPPC